MEYGSNYFFPCSWDGEDRTWSSLQGPTCSEGGLWEQRGCGISLGAAPWWKQGRCVCVCAGVGARQGGVPDPSTLPSKLMQLRSKIHLSYS